MLMNRRLAVLLLALAAGAAEKKPAARTDLYGEPLPSGAIARLGRGDFPRLAAAGTFAFSPDGKWMATAAEDDTLRLEKPPVSLDLLLPFQGPHSPTNSIAVSRDSQSVHSGGFGFIEKDGTWLLTTVVHKKHPRFFHGKEKWLLSAAVSADRNWLAVVCPNGTLRIWAAEHPDTVREIWKHKYPTQAVVFSPDGKQIATAAKDGTIRLWDATSRDRSGQQ